MPQLHTTDHTHDTGRQNTNTESNTTVRTQLTHLTLMEFPTVINNQLEQSISVLMDVRWCLSFFIQILKEHSTSTKCK